MSDARPEPRRFTAEELIGWLREPELALWPHDLTIDGLMRLAATALEDAGRGTTEWGVVLDDKGSTDIYPEAEAREVAVLTGGQLVKITTVGMRPGTANEGETR